MPNVPTVSDFGLFFFLRFKKDSISYLAKLHQQYGDIFHKQILGTDRYFIRNPKFAEQILFTNQENYHRDFSIIRKIKDVIGTKHLAAIEDLKQWKHDRELINHSFDVGLFFNQYTSVITQKCQKILDEWQERILRGEKILPIRYEIQRLTMSITLDTFFCNSKIDIPLIVHTFPELCRMMYEKGLSFTHVKWKLPTQENRKLQGYINLCHQMAIDILDSRLKSGKNYDDLLGSLIHDYHIVDKTSPHYADILDQILLFTLANSFGPESTITRTLVVLSQNPEIEQNISDEVKHVCQGRLPSFEDYPKLIYTQAVIAEVLRLYPPNVYLSRQSINHDELMEYPIPAKAFLLINLYLLHRHPDFWDNPEIFNPERFIKKPFGQDYQFAYLPFGAGQRNCIAKNFALLESCLIVAMISQRFRLSVAKDAQIKHQFFILNAARPNIDEMFLEAK